MPRLLMLAWLLVVGCDDSAALTDSGVAEAGTRDTGPITGHPGGVLGVLRYEDRPYDAGGFTGELVPMPARGIEVELWAAEVMVARTRTDADGRFRFDDTGLPDGTPVILRALTDAAFGEHRVQVVMPRGAGGVYALDAGAAIGDADVSVLAGYEAGYGGAFNVADVAYGAFVVYAPHVAAAAPTLHFAWERGYAFGCGSCYDEEGDVISLGGQFDDTDEYDDHIILHELGHYFVERYGRDTSPGGTHRDRLVSPELAYGEGLAYFFAAMIHGSPVIVDTYEGSMRIIDIEGVRLDGVAREDFVGVSSSGALREEIVAAVLWDAFDPTTADEPFDQVALGVAGQVGLLVGPLADPRAVDQGPEGVDLSDFLHGLECSAEVPPADVQALADDRGFPYVAGGGC